MSDKFFNQLVKSIREAGKISRGEIKPIREFSKTAKKVEWKGSDLDTDKTSSIKLALETQC